MSASDTVKWHYFGTGAAALAREALSSAPRALHNRVNAQVSRPARPPSRAPVLGALAGFKAGLALDPDPRDLPQDDELVVRVPNPPWAYAPLVHEQSVPLVPREHGVSADAEPARDRLKAAVIAHFAFGPRGVTPTGSQAIPQDHCAGRI